MLHTSDDVFVDAPPLEIREALLHAHEDASWWPGARIRGGFAWLELDAPTGRGTERVRFKARIEGVRDEGFRWVFESGPLQGHGEFWLEGYRRGTIVHYLTALADQPRITRELRAHRWAIRIALNGLKDRFSAAVAR